jgi:hypothetical protein
MVCQAGIVFLALFALPTLSFAGAASDAVQPFYAQPGLEFEPSARDRFTDPAQNVLNQNDAIKQSDAEGCLDPALAFDDTDYDLAEVTSTLSLSESIKGDDATVVATFKVLKEPHRIEWKLKMIAGAWKVSDIVSMTGDWALSQFNCE